MSLTIPNSMKERYSSKYISIFALDTIKKALESTNNDCQVLLLTSYGFIKCDLDFNPSSDNPLRKNSDSSNGYSLDLTCISKLRNDTITKLEKESPNIKPVDSGALVYLKNATIYSNGLSSSSANQSVTINEFVVFADQIIGFSLIPRTEN